MTRILIVDDHPIFRDGMASLLAAAGGTDQVETAGTAEEALQMLASADVDVVLMDINLPGISGVEATRRVLDRAPSTAVLMVTMVDDVDTVDTALRAGARGYVLKDAAAPDILAAVRTVASGGAVIGAGVAARLVSQATGPAQRGRTPGDELTPREHQVLSLLAQGATNRQIARRLDLSLKTIQNHVSRILDKMQAADRTDAALKARRWPT